MKHKAHWDSQKEYDSFWNKKPKKKSKILGFFKVLWFSLKLLLALVVLLAFIGCIVFLGKRFAGDKKGADEEYTTSETVLEEDNKYKYTEKEVSEDAEQKEEGEDRLLYEVSEKDTPASEESVNSQSIVDAFPEQIPEYSGKDVIELNDNAPCFNAYDYETIEGEYYTPLDALGRCGTAFAKIDHGMMPTEKRKSIGDIKPTGWNQNKYPGIVNSEPPYLYNRSHLIAFGLTGQNANELNLITGTRHMNAEVMLPYEEQVMRYLDYSDNHVLYRVSPYFKDNELLARGVEMEAYSIEDRGEGISYHVFIYNVQPGIDIDYVTGENSAQ